MSAAISPAAESARPMTNAQLDQLSLNCIRTLSMDAVQQAKSGHPGTPMALAPLVYTLWNRLMRFDPQDPIWPNRDRFVLSNGHASMLLWSVLHLTGTRAVNAKYERLGQPAVSLDDIRPVCTPRSKAQGHPEFHLVSGVETTTGPLGQGVATSVGMAIAEAWLANRYNRPGFEIFDYNIYAVCGDGCMMEGVGSEAASLAGHLALDNLCWIYDNNHITIEGNTRITFTEDIAARFLGYGWNVLRVGDANDIERIEHALDIFRNTKGRPTFIIVDSHIGYGSPHKQDTAAAHGEPLGEEEVRLTKRDYGWPEDAKFLVPDAVRAHFAAGIGTRGAQARGRWTELFAAYRSKYPQLATEIDLMQRRELPAGWDRGLPVFPANPKGIAGRDASGKVLNVLAQNIPWLLGGSADLGTSNKTILTFEGAGDFESGTPGGRNLHFGVREHAMAAAVNGLSLSKLRAYVLADPPGGKPDVILIASGSEVSLCVGAHETLAAEGIRARVVSMPSWDIFEHQSEAYRDSVLPPDITARVAVEQASTFGWERYVGRSGRVIGMKTFGASAPLKELLRKYGFEPERVTEVAKELLGKGKKN